MTPHAYTEDQLVEQPAIGLFADLGWQTVSAMEETFGPGGTLGRETKGEVVLADRLRAALVKFNPTLPPEAIDNAVDELTRDRSAMSPAAANREIYHLMKDGIPVSVPDREHGGQKTERLRVVDWENPEENDYLLVSQFSILWVGRREDRAALLYSPEIQCIKYDERGRKVRKLVWNDYGLNPLELIEAIWREVPDWKEFYELPDGLFRKSVPHDDEVVVRELLANALVHRAYTQRGDIFLNLRPDRLEVHNPGLLPIGVTPRNILHATSKRNPHLAKVFYDLKLMEGEGSGFDRMYEVLLASGRPIPEVQQGDDRVVVTVRKQIARTAIVDFMVKADQTLQPTQKELITLGLLAQHEALTAIELVKVLELSRAEDLKHWIGRLKEWGVVNSRGKTKATEYFIEPQTLRTLEFRGETTLKGIERHRLRELILRDLEIYRKASISQIHNRIGNEIPRRKLRCELAELVGTKEIGSQGVKRGTIYFWTK